MKFQKANSVCLVWKGSRRKTAHISQWTPQEERVDTRKNSVSAMPHKLEHFWWYVSEITLHHLLYASERWSAFTRNSHKFTLESQVVGDEVQVKNSVILNGKVSLCISVQIYAVQSKLLKIIVPLNHNLSIKDSKTEITSLEALVWSGGNKIKHFSSSWNIFAANMQI